MYDFCHELPGCFVTREDVPEAAVAYDERAVCEMYGRQGLRMGEPIRYGSWCGREGGFSKQDIVVACKPGK